MTTKNSAASLNPTTNLRWLRLARGAWYPVVAMVLGIFIASIPGYIVLVPRGFDLSDRLVVNSSPFLQTLNILAGVFSVATVLLSFYLAQVLFRRRPDDRMALFLSYYLLAFGVLAAGPSEALQPFWPGISRQITQVVIVLITLPMSIFLFALFPDGRFVPGWTRWLGFVSFLVVFLMATLPVIGYSLMFTLLFSMLFAQIYRYRHVSTQQQKQQTKWFVYGLGVLLALLIIVSIPRTWSHSLPQSTPDPIWEAGALLVYFISIAIIPLTLTISVMRYRLYDIDILINRTLVYGALTASTMGIYVLAVGFLGNIFQVQGSTFIAFLITGLVALLFQPLRARLQGIVNRLMYGDRDDPMAVLKKLGQQLEETVSPDSALAGIVETVGQTLKLPYVAIVTVKNDEKEITASHGESKNEKVEIPLIYQAQEIGYLVIAKRGSNEDFNPQEISLLENIARQASTTVHAVRLAADLQRSRQHLVTAREEERRRLRRDLHDGLGPVLASQGLKMAAAGRLLDSDPTRAQQMLAELAAQNEATVADIRRLVYALRPALLDELGLVGAISDYAAGLNEGAEEATSFQVEEHKPEGGFPSLSAAIEVAAYRVATEALTNVTRHAHAQRCTVSFRVEGNGDERVLQLEITDDGIGLSEDYKMGVGLTSMRERAEEVGGEFQIQATPKKGTRVIARLPLVE